MKNGSRFILVRLLMEEVSGWQLIVYGLGFFIGLLIIVAGFQLNMDIETVNKSSETGTSDYIVVSSKVDGLSFSPSAHSLENVETELHSQPWVIKAASFNPAKFNVNATVDFAGRSMTTALFFESVPSDFIENIPDEWNFDSDDENPVIPIILPRDYLALYNFGFAASRHLPKIGENVMMSLPLVVSLSGNGRQRNFRAHIAGFTSRLNTIIVPEEVIEWGNREFGNGEPVTPQRLIAEISVEPSDKRVKDFLNKYSLELGGDKALSNSASEILKTIISIMLTVGSIIAVLSFALLVLSIYLLVYKTKDVIYRLLALGYKVTKITDIYTLLFGSVNLIVFILAVIGLHVSNMHFLRLLKEGGFEIAAGETQGVLLAAVITVFITAVCYLIFRMSINKNVGR